MVPLQSVVALKTSKAVERIAQFLMIISFMLMCWVAQRSLEARSSCVTSSFISFVQIDGKRIANCLFESRLSLRGWLDPITPAQEQAMRSIEVLEPLRQVFPGRRLGLAVDISDKEADLFELGKGYVRLGHNWLKDATQLRRALIMGVLRNEFPATYTNQFQLEVVADFLLLAVFNLDEWKGEDGKIYSLVRDMRFSTMAPSFEQYCLSPFRSLSHRSVCHLDGNDDMEHVNVWGFRPLLAVSIWRVFAKLPLREKMAVMTNVTAGRALPALHDLHNLNAGQLVVWFATTLNEHLHVLGVDAGGLAVKQTLRELEVESPTRWELTLDLTATPVWREIVEQMRQRAQFKKERVLIFTPEGTKALPSGLPVAWATDEISSQKHVLIACEWPSPDAAVHVRARHMFAQQSCTKLTSPFWD